MEAFNVQNIIQGNGVAISITGMAIVFCGLLFITLFIQLLPFLLGLSLKRPPQETASSKTTTALSSETAETGSVDTEAAESEDKDIASLIGLVLHLEQERHFYSDNQYITMDRNSGHQSMWSLTGRMRSTPHRRNYAKI